MVLVHVCPVCDQKDAGARWIGGIRESEGMHRYVGIRLSSNVR